MSADYNRRLVNRDIFDYVIDIPEGAHLALPWTARLRVPPEEGWTATVGAHPMVTFENFDVRPGVERTRIRFETAAGDTADFKAVSFVVDRRLAEMFKPNDTLYVARRDRGGFGVSVIRQVLLVGAAGSVSAVPLGGSIAVSLPDQLSNDAEAVFRQVDQKYRMWEVPVQIAGELQVRLLHRGRATIGRYEVFVVNGFAGGTENVAITLPGVCPDCAMTLTAQVINGPDSIDYVPAKTLQDIRFERDARVLFLVETGRAHLATGNLDAAYDAAIEACVYDSDSDAARQLLQEVERRRGSSGE